MDQKWQILNVFMPRLNTHWIQVKMAMFFFNARWYYKIMLCSVDSVDNLKTGNLKTNKFPAGVFGNNYMN